MKNIVCLFAVALAVSFAVNACADEKAASEKTVVETTVVGVQPGADCPCANPCAYPPVAYRVGLFGRLRPVVYAPAPVYVPAPVYAPAYRVYYPYHRPYVYPAYVW